MLAIAGLSVLASAGLLTLHLPRRGLVAAVVAFGLIAWATIVGQMALCGLLLRTLSPEALTAVAVAWLLIVGAISFRRGIRATGLQQRARASLATLRDALASPIPAFVGLLVALSILWRTFLTLRLPVIDYDGWSYHLVTVDVWLQANALVNVPQKIWSDGYPANAELFTAWVSAFSRTDMLAGLTSLLPYPLAMVAVTGLARVLGVDRRTSLVVGGLFGLTPAIAALAGTSYVDIAGVAAIAATWYLGVRFLRGERAMSTAALLGIAGGLAIGSKLGTSLIVVGPMLVASGLVALADVRRAWPQRAWRRPAASVVAITLPVFLLGLSWYIKNLVLHGNPMYPIAFGPFPGLLTTGEFGFVPTQLAGKSWITQLIHSWTWDWRTTRYPYNVRPGGFGLVWLPILALATLGGVELIRRRAVVPIGLIVLPAIVTILVVPQAWYARLVLYAIAIAYPLAGVAFAWLRSWSHPRPGRQWFATIVTAGVLVLVTISFGITNMRPNLTDHYTTADGKRHLLTVRKYVAILLEASDARRAGLGLLGDCSAFRVIPPGSRITPGTNNTGLLHAAVGPPGMDRVLTAPIAGVTTVPELEAAVAQLGTDWLITPTGEPVGAIAAGDPGVFESHGTMCDGATLWRVVKG